MRVFFCLLLFTIISCSDSDNPIDPNCTPVVIDESVFNQDSFNSAAYISHSLDGDCLTVRLGISGCSGDHEIEMVSDGAVMESFPPQMEFDFLDKNLEPCLAFFEVTRQFDLREIADLVSTEVHIGIRGQDGLIVYEP